MDLWLKISMLLLILAKDCQPSEILTQEELENIVNEIPHDLPIYSNDNPVSLTLWKGELCTRICQRNRPRICYYKWVLEYYHVLGPACKNCARGNFTDCYSNACITADGVERGGVMSINRQIPGPAIHVCENDTVVVDVTNAMGGTATTIHWHGLHQRETPFMDGVPFITQCPIAFANTFRYVFKATEPGTQFYHSHSGHHKVNGHYGPFIIRTIPRNDPNSQLYDFDRPDHTMLIHDWMHEDGEMFMPGYPSSGGIGPVSLLINGKGTFRYSLLNSTRSPIEIFRVQRGRRYRFRMINSASHFCPIQIQIQRHRLNIIASDSFPVQPRMGDSLVSTSGERYDFVVEANQPETDYWVRVRAIGACLNRQIEQFAILTYRTNVRNIDLAFTLNPRPLFAAQFQSGVFINHPNTTCYNDSQQDHCIADFSAYETESDIVNAVEPDERFFLGFNMYPVSNEILFAEHNYDAFINLQGNITLMGAINNISYTSPPFSLLTQPELLENQPFCDANSKPTKCANRHICPCMHRIKIKLGSIVELVLVDETRNISGINHPFHLHGFKLYVMGLYQNTSTPMTVTRARMMLATHSLVRSTNRLPPIKDTVSIPSKGYTIVRFRADNPGFWLMHCHFEWHMAAGMGLVLQVGEPEQMVKAPTNFPKCGNYLPNIY